GDVRSSVFARRADRFWPARGCGRRRGQPPCMRRVVGGADAEPLPVPLPRTVGVPGPPCAVRVPPRRRFPRRCAAGLLGFRRRTGGSARGSTSERQTSLTRASCATVPVLPLRESPYTSFVRP